MRPRRLHFTSTVIIITVVATAIIAAVTTPIAVLLVLVFHTHTLIKDWLPWPGTLATF
jgi:hypothetical protein